VKFKVNGKELELSDSIRVGEMCEAEKALGLSLEEVGAAGKTAIMLFIAMRRDAPGQPVSVLASEVMNIDLGAMEVEDDPPAEAPEGGQENQPTTGLQPSAPSASPSTSQT